VSSPVILHSSLSADTRPAVPLSGSVLSDQRPMAEQIAKPDAGECYASSCCGSGAG
jgi:hypothetical protein